jgi:hypothetical protein
MARHFPKCTICGTWGHRDDRCPVAELNAAQEKAKVERITAEMLFPGQPEMVALLKAVQRAWLVHTP